MQVREIMTKSPVCCPPDAPLSEVARRMAEFDCGEIPIVDRDASRPVGVITDRDIAIRTVAQGRNPLELRARDCMTSPVVTVTPDMSLDECCRAMEAAQVRRVPVVDAAGSCCGIVSQADIALHDGRHTAHVVQEISRPSHDAAQPAAAMADDPVCGMRVSTADAAARETFAGETFYFCSKECARTFAERPEDYAGKASDDGDGTRF